MYLYIDVCSKYTNLTDTAWRVSTRTNTGKCDDSLLTGWYRILLNGKNANVLSSQVSPRRCGTVYPIYWTDGW